MKILFAADHAGYELKEQLMVFVRDELGYEVEDHGAHEYDPNDDYPALIEPVAQAVSKAPEHHRAIILGGSGQGEAMVANRFRGVRAAVYYGGPLDIVSLSREHNDANVLSLGARFLDIEVARVAVAQWLDTDFSRDDRHLRRIAGIDNVSAND